MSYGYNQGGNPYDRREQPSNGYNAAGYNNNNNAPQYGNQPASYGNQYNQQASGYNGQNIEMDSMGQNAGLSGRQQDPNAILNECREIDRAVDELEQRHFEQLKTMQLRSLDTNDSRLTEQIDAKTQEITSIYRELTNRLRNINAMPEKSLPRNAPQVGKVDRRLKASLNKFQNVEAEYRRKNQAQFARQYRLVRPDATESEIRDAAENDSQQVFSQALMQSDRRGQVRGVYNAVNDRHKEIQKIEQQMIVLAQLFQDMEEMVVQQEPQVAQIEAKGEEVTENMDKANEQISTAIVSARARNRKKWWCLLIVVLIIIVVVIIVVVYVEVTKGGSSSSSSTNKRSLISHLH